MVSYAAKTIYLHQYVTPGGLETVNTHSWMVNSEWCIIILEQHNAGRERYPDYKIKCGVRDRPAKKKEKKLSHNGERRRFTGEIRQSRDTPLNVSSKWWYWERMLGENVVLIGINSYRCTHFFIDTNFSTSVSMDFIKVYIYVSNIFLPVLEMVTHIRPVGVNQQFFLQQKQSLAY